MNIRVHGERCVHRDPAGGESAISWIRVEGFETFEKNLARKGETWVYETLTKGYFACVYPTTVGKFRRFVGATGYVTAEEKSGEAFTWRKPRFLVGPDRRSRCLATRVTPWCW